MNPQFHPSLESVHNVSVFIQNDRTALAHQLRLCRTERSGWHQLESLIEGAQAFASRYLISMLVLVLAVFGVVSWLVK